MSSEQLHPLVPNPTHLHIITFAPNTGLLKTKDTKVQYTVK